MITKKQDRHTTVAFILLFTVYGIQLFYLLGAIFGELELSELMVSLIWIPSIVLIIGMLAHIIVYRKRSMDNLSFYVVVLSLLTMCLPFLGYYIVDEIQSYYVNTYSVLILVIVYAFCSLGHISSFVTFVKYVQEPSNGFVSAIKKHDIYYKSGVLKLTGYSLFAFGMFYLIAITDFDFTQTYVSGYMAITVLVPFVVFLNKYIKMRQLNQLYATIITGLHLVYYIYMSIIFEPYNAMLIRGWLFDTFIVVFYIVNGVMFWLSIFSCIQSERKRVDIYFLLVSLFTIFNIINLRFVVRNGIVVASYFLGYLSFINVVIMLLIFISSLNLHLKK